MVVLARLAGRGAIRGDGDGRPGGCQRRKAQRQPSGQAASTGFHRVVSEYLSHCGGVSHRFETPALIVATRMSVTHERKPPLHGSSQHRIQHTPGTRPQARPSAPCRSRRAASEGGVHFRVWASQPRHVEVVLEGGPGSYAGAAPVVVALEPEGHGYFSGLVAAAGAGTRYRYRLDGGADLYADPASRFQPDGPHGPSQVIDPGAFQWHDQDWRGVPLEGQVLYEMHLGTFTPTAPGRRPCGELPALAELGVTVLEIMPIADFPGRFGWGYDGVNLFAPTRLYGTPDDCRRFIDRAHALGLGVILDVVYNHLGPDGNFLAQFSPDYFTRSLHDGLGSRPLTTKTSMPVRCASFSWPMPATGSRNFTSMVCAWTPPRTSTTPRRTTSWRPSPAGCGRQPVGAPPCWWPRTNRSTRSWSAPGARRLWPGRALERRLPPQRHGRPDRAPEAYYTRLPRDPAGVHLRLQVGLPLPGAVLHVAAAAAWHPGLGSPAGSVCDLSAEP